jgi:hypothetical protein
MEVGMDKLLERLQKLSVVIYLAVAEAVADDISKTVTEAADEITRLNAEVERARTEIASLRSERSMLVTAVECLDSYARGATFGGWRHRVADITGAALQRSFACANTRRALRATPNRSPEHG